MGIQSCTYPMEVLWALGLLASVKFSSPNTWRVLLYGLFPKWKWVLRGSWWVWDTLTPKTAPWNIEYLNLEELEKEVEIGRSLWPVLARPSLKQLTHLHVRGARLHQEEGRPPGHQRWELGTEKSIQTNPIKLSLIFPVTFPPFSTPITNSSPVISSQKHCFFVSNAYKSVFWSLFFCEDFHVHVKI